MTRSRPASRSAAAAAPRCTPLVVRERSARPGWRDRRADETGQIAAQQRLATGEADAGDAFPDEDPDEAIDLLEAQQVGARQPDVLRLGHAVEAAEVAAVGHRHAQRAQRPVEGVEHGHLFDYGIAPGRPCRSLLQSRRPHTCAADRESRALPQSTPLSSPVASDRRRKTVRIEAVWGLSPWAAGPDWPFRRRIPDLTTVQSILAEDAQECRHCWHLLQLWRSFVNQFLRDLPTWQYG